MKLQSRQRGLININMAYKRKAVLPPFWKELRREFSLT